jgi:hypothetical protein
VVRVCAPPLMFTPAKVRPSPVAIFAAFAISRYRFRGRGIFSITVLATQMFPGILFLLPLFLIYVNRGNATGIQLYASRLGLIITYLTFSLPFSIWMLAGYFDAIPRSLDEAAYPHRVGDAYALGARNVHSGQLADRVRGGRAVDPQQRCPGRPVGGGEPDLDDGPPVP